METNIVRRRNGETSPIYQINTLQEISFCFKSQIFSAIHKISPFSKSEHFTNMKSGGPALRNNFFVRALKEEFRNKESSIRVKVQVNSKTKDNLMLGEYRLAVSLTSGKLESYKLSILESADPKLPSPEEYPVHGFLIAQTNDPDLDRRAAFTIITYDEIYGAWLSGSSQVCFEKLGRTSFKIEQPNWKYEDKVIKQYKHSEEHRNQEVNQAILAFYNSLVEFSKGE